jgi:hypothetical protein
VVCLVCACVGGGGMDPYILAASIGLIRAEKAGPIQDDVWLDYSNSESHARRESRLEIKQDPHRLE